MKKIKKRKRERQGKSKRITSEEIQVWSQVPGDSGCSGSSIIISAIIRQIAEMKSVIWSFTTLWSMLSMNSLDAKKEDPWNEIQV